MSQNPNLPYGYGYGYGYPQPNRRPASVIAVAVISIVLGTLGLLCDLGFVANLVVDVQPPNPIVHAVQASTLARNWIIGTSVFQCVLSLLLVVGSIGLFLTQGWVRRLMNLWAGLAILLALMSCIIGFTHVTPALEAAGANFGMPEVDDKAAAAVVPIVFGCMTYLLAIWAIIVLIVINLPGVSAAFAGQGQAPPGYPAGGYGMPGYYPPPYGQGYAQSYPPPPQAPPPPSPQPPQGSQPPHGPPYGPQ